VSAKIEIDTVVSHQRFNDSLKMCTWKRSEWKRQVQTKNNCKDVPGRCESHSTTSDEYIGRWPERISHGVWWRFAFAFAKSYNQINIITHDQLREEEREREVRITYLFQPGVLRRPGIVGMFSRHESEVSISVVHRPPKVSITW
jgi:hypothetical protein